jgi:hypothetical protein
MRPSMKGFIRINKLKETIIYLYCLSIKITIIARPPLAMIAKTAFIAGGRPS